MPYCFTLSYIPTSYSSIVHWKAKKKSSKMDRHLLRDIRRAVEYIDEMLYNPNVRWEKLVQSARNLMALLDSTAFFGSSSGVDLQIHAIEVLQKFAYQDVDLGGICDIADWCLECWLRCLQRDPNNVRCLKGVIARLPFSLNLS
jgi:hypothetical protein